MVIKSHLKFSEKFEIDSPADLNKLLCATVVPATPLAGIRPKLKLCSFIDLLFHRRRRLEMKAGFTNMEHNRRVIGAERERERK